jgi:hypothetical protein
MHEISSTTPPLDTQAPNTWSHWFQYYQNAWYVGQFRSRPEKLPLYTWPSPIRDIVMKEPPILPSTAPCSDMGSGVLPNDLQEDDIPRLRQPYSGGPDYLSMHGGW